MARTASSLLALAVIVLAAGAGAGGSASGQESNPATRGAASKSPEAMIEARGERQLRQLRFSGWRKLCFQPAEAMICRTSIAGATEAGQEMLRVDLIEGAAGTGGRLQIFVPPMLFLEAGVRVIIDKGNAVDVPFAWCFSNTCVAARAVDAAFIRRMKTGRDVTLKVVDSRISTVMTSVPLDQFASVNQGAPNLMFGRSLEPSPSRGTP
ncbi:MULTISPECIES: invasion associated locus B family protein [Bradyrhizobium]|uniref:invasion associated locus B family protein n=1 Tax=Bradyrhizobium TaxID=374 RepID=UPI001B8A01F8|nr:MULTISPECIES: invasion associated locus B family protein [Bradyrhizobium]MBR0973941.1 invasion associated locus B family protein [Bradyrhizobium japonicum]